MRPAHVGLEKGPPDLSGAPKCGAEGLAPNAVGVLHPSTPQMNGTHSVMQTQKMMAGMTPALNMSPNV